MSNIKMRPFDMANYLGTEEEIVEYLRQALEDNDPAELAAALGDIARARGMTQLARDTGLSRESLYKSLSGLLPPCFRSGRCKRLRQRRPFASAITIRNRKD